MCVIIVVPAGVDVPLTTIDLATAKNPHGWGMTIKHPERGLLVRRGWSPRSARRAWQRAGTEFERVFHARIATGGNKDMANTHPFEITNLGLEPHRRMFFHNGTVSMPSLFPEYCDSWHLAQLLKMVPFATIPKNLDSYAREERSRFVVVSGDMAQETWMMGNGWTERDGAHYSNTFMFPSPIVVKNQSYHPPLGPQSPYWNTEESPYGKWEHGEWVPKDELNRRREEATGEVAGWEVAREIFRENRRSARQRLRDEASGHRGKRITTLEEWEAAERERWVTDSLSYPDDYFRKLGKSE